ncbi:MAG: hypothetical protein SGCHY_004070 [Lobulomycetales sp.]
MFRKLTRRNPAKLVPGLRANNDSAEARLGIDTAVPEPEAALVRQATESVAYPPDLSTPLEIAIWYHENNHLTQAAIFLQQSAAQGDPIGILLYAITLRHGMGVTQDQVKAFRLLQNSADKTLMDSGDSNVSATLKRFTAKIAAQLGDPEAMVELAQLYLDGRGVRRNKHIAAKWFREAHQHGKETFGTHWIWKEKFLLEKPSKTDKQKVLVKVFNKADLFLLSIFVSWQIWVRLKDNSNISEWSTLKKYYMATFTIGLFYLASHSMVILGCQSDYDYEGPYCKVSIMSLAVSLGLGSLTFMLGTIFSYRRLTGRLLDAKDSQSWIVYKAILITTVVLFVGISALATWSEKYDSIMSITKPAEPWIVWLRVAVFSIGMILGTLVMGVGVYCYASMLKSILSTSGKVSRMKRTDQKGEIIQMQRKLYGLVFAAMILSSLCTSDILFNKYTFSGFLIVTFGLILGHLLGIIRDSIQKLKLERVLFESEAHSGGVDSFASRGNISGGESTGSRHDLSATKAFGSQNSSNIELFIEMHRTKPATS